MQKKSQISLRCKKYRKHQLACEEKNGMLMSRNDDKRKTEEESPSLTLAGSWTPNFENNFLKNSTVFVVESQEI